MSRCDALKELRSRREGRANWQFAWSSLKAASKESRQSGQFALPFSEEVIMTLKSRKVFSAVHMSIIVLSLVSSSLAQAPRTRQVAKDFLPDHRAWNPLFKAKVEIAQ